MWYRQAQIEQPNQEINQVAVSGHQTIINNILAQNGKTFNEIINQLNVHKISVNSSLGLNDPTKTNIASLIDSYITNLTSSAAGNLNKTYIPPQNENKVVNVNPNEPLDPMNPAARLIDPLSKYTVPRGTGGGLLQADRIKQRVGPTMALPAAVGVQGQQNTPAGQQNAQTAPQQAVPGKTLYDALKEAGITQYAFGGQPLPLDQATYKIVLDNLIASKTNNPQAMKTLQDLLERMGVYLTLNNNVMVFSKNKEEDNTSPVNKGAK